MATAENIIRKHRDEPLRDSIGPIACALARQSLFVGIDGAVPPTPTPLLLRVGTDKQGCLWAFAYTSYTDISKAFPQGTECAEITFAKLIQVVDADASLAGIILNSASEHPYPIFKEFFEEVKRALRDSG